jgi:2-polyprenyl-6-hydroxyphenyl methylase/3-demethylubiquinone-9 3-methyltransferase
MSLASPLDPSLRTTDPVQIARFAKDSAHWWDETGPFAPLHRLTPVRMTFLRDALTPLAQVNAPDRTPLKGLKILDIGCGGGLACEPLARMGAEVTGIDADPGAIACAQSHAQGQRLEIDYQVLSAEALLSQPSRAQSFDAVLGLEVLEHASDPAAFMACCAALVRPGGAVVVSTLNRTAKAFVLGIVAAEYVLGWVPRGTHQWCKFLKPSEVARMGRAGGLRPVRTAGLVFDPFRRAFRLSGTDLGVNYFIHFEKDASGSLP